MIDNETVRLRLFDPFGHRNYGIGEEFIVSYMVDNKLFEISFGKVVKRDEINFRNVGGMSISSGYTYETVVTKEQYEHLSSGRHLTNFIGGKVTVVKGNKTEDDKRRTE